MFLLEFIQFTSSLPGFILSLIVYIHWYISIVVFKQQTLFLNLRWLQPLSQPFQVDSDKFIGNDSKNTVTLITHRY